jgi:hypothetical protein
MGQYLFIIILSISGFCLGWRTITSEGMILGWLREWSIKHLHSFIAKPFILCITCLSSFWGTIIFWIYFLYLNAELNIFTIFAWIFSCIVCAFINTIAWNLKTLTEKKINN